MLRVLEGVADEVPLRCNCAVSGAEDLIAHYIEAEIREALGETRGCLGWPPNRLKKVRGRQLVTFDALPGGLATSY